MEENEREELIEELIEEISSCKDEELQGIFARVYPILKNGNKLIKSWRKVHLTHAIGAFHTKWFDYCRDQLKSTLEVESKISTDDRYTKSLFKEADSIDDKLLESEISKLKKL